jgi:uncharacterized membrane protein YccC
MLALYIALRLALPRPFWAMMTAYVVATPLAGAVRSKALYRVLGTILGCTAMLLLVPQFINAPELLTIVLAAWVSICLYISILDRTPRSYIFMLAGYTATMVAFPTITDPLGLFDAGLARVEEICIGILCGTLVHTLFLPRKVAPVLLGRLDKAMADVKVWISDTLLQSPAEKTAKDRKTLATDMTDLRMMATHLPFDTSHLRWMTKSISALHNHLSLLVPTLSAIENDLRELHKAKQATRQQKNEVVLQAIHQWIHHQGAQDATQQQHLHATINSITPTITAQSAWYDIIQLSLCEKLHTLINLNAECRVLRTDIGHVASGKKPTALDQIAPLPKVVLHTDHGIAFRSALATFLAIVTCCAFWIATGWTAGAAAPVMAAVFCCLFATFDNPLPLLKINIKFTLISIPLSAFYLLVALPAVHSFTMMVAVLAPVYLFLGCYLATPKTLLPSIAVIFGVATTLSFQDTNNFHVVNLFDSSMAQLGGTYVALFFVKLMRTFNPQWTARRLLHAGWKDLADIATASVIRPINEMTILLLDRISLLAPRLAMSTLPKETYVNDALRDLRIGIHLVKLRNAESNLHINSLHLGPLMHAIAQHFKKQDALKGYISDDTHLLTHLIDHLIGQACRAQLQSVTATLANLRQDLLPNAAPYKPALTMENITP